MNPIYQTRILPLRWFANMCERIASPHLMKAVYLDEDKDYVLRQAPCPFLGADNYCSVYEDRPNACREYPHTDRKKISQLLDLTYKNTFVCPAVLEITEQLKKIKF